MKLSFYDPKPPKNLYVSRMFLQPMALYAESGAVGAKVKWIDTPTPETGWVMICNADYLTPEIIQHHKDCGCKLICISCIDSAHLSETLRHQPLTEYISKVFMVSGVQNTNYSEATVIDSDFNIKTELRQFLPWNDWARFNRMRESGQLQSLPYVPWHPLDTSPMLSFSEKRPTILFRGGNHFWRFITYLSALQSGCADEKSGFQTSCYFADDMNPQFRYCEPCRERYKNQGGVFTRGMPVGMSKCNNPAIIGADCPGIALSETGKWNNRCPESFFWLAGQYAETNGPVDMNAVERALNYKNQHPAEHLRAITEARFYAECKWDFSINAPQRFWEAASMGTVNLLPQRASEQDYFPRLIRGEHYYAFRNDLKCIHAQFEESDYVRIVQNALDAYEQYIRPSQYVISTGLLSHIIDQIKSCSY